MIATFLISHGSLVGLGAQAERVGERRGGCAGQRAAEGGCQGRRDRADYVFQGVVKSHLG